LLATAVQGAPAPTELADPALQKIPSYQSRFGRSRPVVAVAVFDQVLDRIATVYGAATADGVSYDFEYARQPAAAQRN
jgi:hypothetical protein